MKNFQGLSCLERNRQWGTAWVWADSIDTRWSRVLYILVSWLLTSPLSLCVGDAHSAQIWYNVSRGKCLDLHEKLQRQDSVCSLSSFLWRHPWKPLCFWNSQAELAKDRLPRDLALSHLSSSLMVLLMQDSVSRNSGQIPLPLTLGSTGGFCRKLWGKAAEVGSLPCSCRRFTTQWVLADVHLGFRFWWVEQFF